MIENRGDYRILIAYASKFGSTGEIAEAIGDTLSQDGRVIDTQRIGNVENVSRYDAVIVGSAIQYDKWMPEATDFVIRNQEILENVPVAYFFTCMTLSKRNEKAERKALGYSTKLRALSPRVSPMEIGRFAGALDYSKMSFPLRLILGGILTSLGVKEDDYRDWDAVRTWAGTIDLEFEQRRNKETHSCVLC